VEILLSLDLNNVMTQTKTVLMVVHQIVKLKLAIHAQGLHQFARPSAETESEWAMSSVTILTQSLETDAQIVCLIMAGSVY